MHFSSHVSSLVGLNLLTYLLAKIPHFTIIRQVNVKQINLR